MYKLVSEKLFPLTREYAEYFAGLPATKGDRDTESLPGKRRIELLKNKVLAGEFFSLQWAVAKHQDILYRANGGNSSKMLVNHLPPEKFPTNLNVHFMEFDCPTEVDLALLFEQFDSRASARSALEKTNAHLVTEEELANVITVSMTSRANSGIAFFLRETAGLSFNEDMRIRLMHEHKDFIAWTAEFLAIRHVCRTGVVAAMFATWTHNQENATMFWRMVRDENAPDNMNATRELARFLRDSMVHNGSKSHAKWTPRAFYVKSILAWNAWRDDRQTNLKYSPKAMLPKIK